MFNKSWYSIIESIRKAVGPTVLVIAGVTGLGAVWASSPDIQIKLMGTAFILVCPGLILTIINS